MRIVVALLVAAAFCAEPRAEEYSARWRSADGSMSLAISEHGWRQVDRSDHPDWFSEDPLVLATPVGDEVPNVICGLMLSASADAPRGVSQAVLNDRLRATASVHVDHFRTQQDWAIVRYEVRDVDGVAILEVHSTFRRLQGTMRRFVLQQGGEVKIYTLSCSSPLGDEQAAASVRLVADSLRFGGN